VDLPKLNSSIRQFEGIDLLFLLYTSVIYAYPSFLFSSLSLSFISASRNPSVPVLGIAPSLSISSFHFAFAALAVEVEGEKLENHSRRHNFDLDRFVTQGNVV